MTLQPRGGVARFLTVPLLSQWSIHVCALKFKPQKHACAHINAKYKLIWSWRVTARSRRPSGMCDVLPGVSLPVQVASGLLYGCILTVNPIVK